MKSIYINAAGCAEVMLDGASFRQIAEKHGYRSTDRLEEADLVVVFTCTVKQHEEDLSIELVKDAQKRMKPGAELVVAGCLVGVNKPRLDQIFKGVTIAPTELEKFYDVIHAPHPERLERTSVVPRDISDQEMFGQRRIVQALYDIRKFFSNQLGVDILPNLDLQEYLGDEDTQYVLIGRGCNAQCAYCADRFAVGPVKSEPVEEIIKNIQDGLKEGRRKIYLIATNSAAYGADFGCTFNDLLQKILEDTRNDYKLLIHNFEPVGITRDPERFLELFSSPRVRMVYIPINSGSQKTLNRMRRGYRIDHVIETLKELRRRNPDVLLRTEFIAGFPGETWGDFLDTVFLIHDFDFDLIDLHCYSPRPRTTALELDGHLPYPIRYGRYLMLFALVFLKIWTREFRPF